MKGGKLKRKLNNFEIFMMSKQEEIELIIDKYYDASPTIIAKAIIEELDYERLIPSLVLMYDHHHYLFKHK